MFFYSGDAVVVIVVVVYMFKISDCRLCFVLLNVKMLYDRYEF